jgi:enamine deaminase RidA (YjgF/YER057c/UK114 family)
VQLQYQKMAEAKLKELGIDTDPDFVKATEQAAVPVDTSKYCLKPVLVVDRWVYLSGAGPLKADGSMDQGKLGDGSISIEEAQVAARRVGYCHLAALRAAVGSLDRVERIVKALGMVNSTPDFGAQPAVSKAHHQRSPTRPISKTCSPLAST